MKRLFAAILCALTLTGCGTTAKFVYPANVQHLTTLYEVPKYDRAVAALPFEEARSDKNSAGPLFLYVIPLMPFGFVTYDRPDAAKPFVSILDFTFNVPEDLAKASVTSLQKSNLFRHVYFSYGGDLDKADFVFHGKVTSTRYEGKVYSYGLSVFGPFLWFFGLPAGSSMNQLSLELTLTKPNSNTPLWHYTTKQATVLVQGLYYYMGHDVKAYTTLMEDAMNDAVKDLDQKLPAIVTN